MTKLGAPSDRLQPIRDLGIEALECNQRLEDFNKSTDLYQSFSKTTGIPVFLSPLRDEGLEKRTHGHVFSHLIRAGFFVDELSEHSTWMKNMVSTDCLAGVVVRHEFQDDLVFAAEHCASWARACQCKIQLSIKTAASSTVVLNDDTERLSELTKLALELSSKYPELFFVFDTFADIDRGYYPRFGFIDGHFNLRPAAQTWQKMVAASSH